MSKVVELYGLFTSARDVDWAVVSEGQLCPYLNRKCLKVRKSEPEQTIGTCTVLHGQREPSSIIICPYRLLERGQIFTDCLHLLSRHEPGNELHTVSEISIPGGSVDYFLVSADEKRVVDFVGIELQTLDTTGTVWPERQRFLNGQGVGVRREDIESNKPFGMNWKMTAKTTLIQLHHKVKTFEVLGKHLALVIQNPFLSYMESRFRFGHFVQARTENSLHIHSYQLNTHPDALRLRLDSRISTDANGIAEALGPQADSNVELDQIIQQLEAKISGETLFRPVG
jgi:hypothetical protein